MLDRIEQVGKKRNRRKGILLSTEGHSGEVGAEESFTSVPEQVTQRQQDALKAFMENNLPTSGLENDLSEVTEQVTQKARRTFLPVEMRRNPEEITLPDLEKMRIGLESLDMRFGRLKSQLWHNSKSKKYAIERGMTELEALRSNPVYSDSTFDNLIKKALNFLTEIAKITNEAESFKYADKFFEDISNDFHYLDNKISKTLPENQSQQLSAQEKATNHLQFIDWVDLTLKPLYARNKARFSLNKSNVLEALKKESQRPEIQANAKRLLGQVIEIIQEGETPTAILTESYLLLCEETKESANVLELRMKQVKFEDRPEPGNLILLAKKVETKKITSELPPEVQSYQENYMAYASVLCASLIQECKILEGGKLQSTPLERILERIKRNLKKLSSLGFQGLEDVTKSFLDKTYRKGEYKNHAGEISEFSAPKEVTLPEDVEGVKKIAHFFLQSLDQAKLPLGMDMAKIHESLVVPAEELEAAKAYTVFAQAQGVMAGLTRDFTECNLPPDLTDKQQVILRDLELAYSGIRNMAKETIRYRNGKEQEEYAEISLKKEINRTLSQAIYNAMKPIWDENNMLQEIFSQGKPGVTKASKNLEALKTLLPEFSQFGTLLNNVESLLAQYHSKAIDLGTLRAEVKRIEHELEK